MVSQSMGAVLQLWTETSTGPGFKVAIGIEIEANLSSKQIKGQH